MQRRKKLLRVAIMLKTVFLTYRESFFDLDLTRIEFRDGVLYLYQKLHLETASGYHGCFPDHLTTNNEHKEAALANNQCTAAMAILSRLTWKVLAGKRPLNFKAGRGGNQADLDRPCLDY